MPSATVRISEPAREMLRDLAAHFNEPMQLILEKAIEAYRRQCFLESTNAAFVALRADEKAWQKELEEREAWDATLTDGEER